MYDVIVIGHSIASWSAAIYAARKGLSVLTLSDAGMRHAGVRLNKYAYPGFLGIDAERLVYNMRKQAEELGVSIVSADDEIQKVSFVQEDGKEVFVVAYASGSHRGKSVIIATGKKPQRLGVPGEDILQGKGVMYYQDQALVSPAEKPIACVVNSEEGLKAALRIAMHKNTVFLFDMSGSGEGARIKKRMEKRGNVTFLSNMIVQKIIGSDSVRGVLYKDMKSGEDHELLVEEVCILAGETANSDCVSAVCDRTKAGDIIIDPKTNATSHIGIFAAGDVTDGVEKDAIISAGEGARAALRCAAWVSGR